MRFTVLGSGGFIGSHLVRSLRARGDEVHAIGRDESALPVVPLGHVIDCAGLTADFRDRPLETVEAHVCRVARLLSLQNFDSYLYLSSTRVYRGLASGEENSPLRVDPSDRDDLYAASKIAGESLCLSDERPTIRVTRLSNTYGLDSSSHNFLASLIVAGLCEKRIVLRESPRTARDFVAVYDVTSLLPVIAERGSHRLYNIAGGVNITSGAVAGMVAELTGASLELPEEGDGIGFPPISISRVRDEFSFRPRQIEETLPSIVRLYAERTVA